MKKKSNGKAKSKRKAKANGKPTAAAKVAAPRAPRPRPQRLPGMEDAAIQELQDAALEYVDIRDERMALSQQEGELKATLLGLMHVVRAIELAAYAEGELKAKLLGLMHEHKRDTYTCNGIEISVIHEEETVKVKVKKQDATADDVPVQDDTVEVRPSA